MKVFSLPNMKYDGWPVGRLFVPYDAVSSVHPRPSATRPRTRLESDPYAASRSVTNVATSS
jgi:hypothetical protein